jgi:hypothetical protein
MIPALIINIIIIIVITVVSSNGQDQTQDPSNAGLDSLPLDHHSDPEMVVTVT